MGRPKTKLGSDVGCGDNLHGAVGHLSRRLCARWAWCTRMRSTMAWHGPRNHFSMHVSGRTRDHAVCVVSFALNTLVMISHWTTTKSHCVVSWTRKKPLTRRPIWLQAKYHRAADCTLGHKHLLLSAPFRGLTHCRLLALPFICCRPNRCASFHGEVDPSAR